MDTRDARCAAPPPPLPLPAAAPPLAGPAPAAVELMLGINPDRGVTALLVNPAAEQQGNHHTQHHTAVSQ
jgi:hypothetical protein